MKWSLHKTEHNTCHQSKTYTLKSYTHRYQQTRVPLLVLDDFNKLLTVVMDVAIVILCLNIIFLTLSAFISISFHINQNFNLIKSFNYGFHSLCKKVLAIVWNFWRKLFIANGLNKMAFQETVLGPPFSRNRIIYLSYSNCFHQLCLGNFLFHSKSLFHSGTGIYCWPNTFALHNISADRPIQILSFHALVTIFPTTFCLCSITFHWLHCVLSLWQKRNNIFIKSLFCVTLYFVVGYFYCRLSNSSFVFTNALVTCIYYFIIFSGCLHHSILFTLRPSRYLYLCFRDTIWTAHVKIMKMPNLQRSTNNNNELKS